jgi:ABC-type transporter lipoprotein component MlaA
VVLKPVAIAYQAGDAADGAHGRQQFLRQPLGRLVVREQRAAVQVPQCAAENFMRVNVNTFFGLGGILDVASEFNIDATGRILARPWAAGAFPQGRTLFCRCWVRPPCGTHWR